MSSHRAQMRAGPTPRPLSAAERAVLVSVLLHADFDGRDGLLAAVDGVLVVGGCGCGCGSVDLRGADDAGDGAAYRVPNEAVVLDGEGNAIGGVLVFAANGYLRQLEIYAHGPEPIRFVPPIDRLRLEQIPR
jgi:hypothetical protein